DRRASVGEVALVRVRGRVAVGVRGEDRENGQERSDMEPSNRGKEHRGSPSLARSAAFADRRTAIPGAQAPAARRLEWRYARGDSTVCGVSAPRGTLPEEFTLLEAVFDPEASAAHLHALLADLEWEEQRFTIYGRSMA